MHRRTFCSNLLLLSSASALPLAGCGEAMDDKRQTVSVPPFSRGRLHVQLDALRVAFEAKGHHVSRSLLPPLHEQELKERCTWFPGALPEELVALYAWRGGQGKGAHEEEYPFWFRDCAFSSPERAEQEYKSMMESYGANPEDHELLKHSFPFASFNGGWLVLPCKDQRLDKRLQRPVISVMQGVDIHFYSLQLMVDTCVDWVSHPQYDRENQLPGAIEVAIWRRHNPGIFDTAA